jgi:AraC-like DNA-binding protein
VRASFEHVETEGPTSWKYEIRREASFSFEWHYHPAHELTFIVRGSGRRFVGDSIEPYAPGDLVLLGPGLPHTWHSSDSSCEHSAAGEASQEAIVLQFAIDFLGAELWSRPEFGLVADLLKNADRGLAFPSEGTEAIKHDLGHLGQRSPDERTVDLLGVLVALAHTPARPLTSGVFRPALDKVTRDRINAARRHISEHFSEHLSREAVAEITALSPAAFSRIFRRSTGKTFTGYLTAVRISAARQLLIETEANVADVAFRCGFRNLSNFNRRFRVLTGVSPREYRAAYDLGRGPVTAAGH